MIDPHDTGEEPTAVDDVRRVREAIARRHGDDLHEHVAETNRIAAQLREKLGVRPVTTVHAEEVTLPR